VLARIALPRKIIILGVRHYPRGEAAAILSRRRVAHPFWAREIDEPLAEALKKACPLLCEDSVAHSGNIPWKCSCRSFRCWRRTHFVPVALGTLQFDPW